MSNTCCHILTLISALAVTSNRPELSHAMPLTLSECAFLTSDKPTPEIASHILMLPSRPPLARMVPKDMYISEKTDDWQELIRDNGLPARGHENERSLRHKCHTTRYERNEHLPVSAFQTTMKESWSPLAIIRLQLRLGDELLVTPGPQQQQQTVLS